MVRHVKLPRCFTVTEFLCLHSFYNLLFEFSCVSFLCFTFWHKNTPFVFSISYCLTNGLFRAFIPKGASVEDSSQKYILSAADDLNGLPRKKLGYRTPEELFEVFLDSVFAT